jgi:hypothetical protein
MVRRLRLCGLAAPRNGPACLQAQWVKGVRLHRARIAVAGFDRSERGQQWSLQNPANGPKRRPSCWSNSRSGKKECQRWRESLGVTSPPLDDELANWVCFCRKAEVRGSSSFSRAVVELNSRHHVCNGPGPLRHGHPGPVSPIEPSTSAHHCCTHAHRPRPAATDVVESLGGLVAWRWRSGLHASPPLERADLRAADIAPITPELGS